MKYDLSGVVRIIRGVNKSTFLIPFFRSDNSNRLFAQELSSEHKIIKFVEINTENYEVLLKSMPPIHREVGEAGIMAYIRRDGDIVVGEAGQVITGLRATSLEADNSPFFEIDAYRLTGQPKKLRAAIKRARRAFGDGEIANAWAQRERAVGAGATPQQVASQELTLSLIESDLELEIWPEHWFALWRSGMSRFRLSEVGLLYVLKGVGNTGEKGRILGAIASYKRSHEISSFYSACIHWLNDCNRLDYYPYEWGKIWLSLDNEEITTNDSYVKYAVSFLESRSPKKSSRQWALVWIKIYENFGYKYENIEEKLLNLAGSELFRSNMANIVVRTMLGFLSKRAKDFRIRTIVIEWLHKSQHSSSWIDTYISVMVPEEADGDLLYLGKRWLDEDDGRLRRWVDIYSLIERIEGGTIELREIAKRWLLRANKNMKTWPDMATRYLLDGWDPEVGDAAKEWMNAHVDHAALWDLNLIIASNEERMSENITLRN
ncbi:hypothetical protein [Caulobacter segnis]